MSQWFAEQFGITNHSGYITLGVLTFCVVALIAWDIWVVGHDKTGDHNTISEILAKLARSHPLIPFAAGVLVGHWFWTQYTCLPGCAP